MGAQTSYGYKTAKGIAGGLYDITTYENNTFTTPGGVPFGYGVVKGENPGSDVKLPDADSTAEDFEGVVQNGFTTMQDNEGNAVPEKGQSIGVLKQGKIWAVVGEAAVPAYDKPVYLIVTGDEAGRFTTKEDTSEKLALPARFVGGADNGIAPIRVQAACVAEKEESKA
ncbi:MAG: hypothetical protein K1W20_04885 [Lachnospiraceae bacterium]